MIRRDGEVETGRPIDCPGAHARGYNQRSLGICLVGGVAEDGKTPENNFTPMQFDTLGILLHQLLTLAPDAEILGHRDLPNVAKACPSFDVRAWWMALDWVTEKHDGEGSEREEDVAAEGEPKRQSVWNFPASPPNSFWTRIRSRPERD